LGKLVDGQWVDKWYDTAKSGGRFVRRDSVFRNWVTSDGSPGPHGSGGFKAESGRYHLYVSLACPWAHRTLIFRKLKGLEDLIDVTVVEPHMLEHGWELGTAGRGSDPNPDLDYLYEVYVRAEPHYTGRVTVPVLWDRKIGTIVNNESSEIIRMFNQSFNAITGNDLDLYPPELSDEIDAINRRVYDCINNGVYKAGFATTQEAYEEAVVPLFSTLDELDDLLSQQPYLVGEVLTEADWRLFTTLVRFDLVYYTHFKCNIRRIRDYAHLYPYLRRLYRFSGVAETVNVAHIKQHYFYSHANINPTRVVPLGPIFDLDG